MSATRSPKEPWSEARARELARRHEDERGPLLPGLHELHNAFGYLDRRSIATVADVLNLSEAEVFGVKSFYRDFRSEPSAAAVVKICRAEACQATGADALLSHAAERLGVAIGETTPDDSIRLEQVFCLGNCSLSPSVMVEGDVFGRVDAARFDELVARSQL